MLKSIRMTFLNSVDVLDIYYVPFIEPTMPFKGIAFLMKLFLYFDFCGADQKK